MTTATNVLPMLLTEVEVVSVERLSPTFVRVETIATSPSKTCPSGVRISTRILPSSAKAYSSDSSPSGSEAMSSRIFSAALSVTVTI